MQEIFKTVFGYPDYEVSNCGRVRTKQRKVRFTHALTGKEHFRETESRFLKVQLNLRTGYKFHQLYLNKKMHNKTVHRLVAETFLEREEGKDYVNHKDGNKHNNTVNNLEWCTNEYNHKHATETGLLAKGEKVNTAKLNKKCVIAIKKLLSMGYKHKIIAELFDVDRSAITLISTNRTWKHIKI